MAKKVKRQLKAAKEEKTKDQSPKTGSKRSAKLLFAPFKIFRYIIPPYFRNAWKELKQVKWPSRKETWQLSLAVFAFAIVFGIIITITDYGLDRVFKRILLK